MKRLFHYLVFGALIIGVAGSLGGAERNSTPSPAAPVQANYGKLPLRFEANFGQTDSQVKFLSRGSGYVLFLTPTEAVLALAGEPPAKDPSPTAGLELLPVVSERAVLRMKLLGANPAPKLEGREELPGKSHYLIGNDPRQWRTHVPAYARVKQGEVYPGVDLVYYGHEGQLEYDFVVAPGADPGTIRLGIEGAEKLELNADGDLLLHTAAGTVVQRKPRAYQRVNGSQREVAAHYLLEGDRQVGFLVDDYNREQPLIIDPVLAYSTYLGGSRWDNAGGVAVDGAGSFYVTGWTDSPEFPVANAAQPFKNAGVDAYVTKLDPSSTGIVYSTYIGGSSLEVAHGLAVDAAGSAHITGLTDSLDFPVANAFQPLRAEGISPVDAFVTKLSPDGSAFVFSTYLGGTSIDQGADIAVDTSGVYVTGTTYSTDFPVANALQATRNGSPDAFVTKLDPAGSALVYSTYLGGSYGDSGYGIAVDPSGNVYVTGWTHSGDFPTANPLKASSGPVMADAFVAKLDPSGTAFVYSTFLGGDSNRSSGETGYAIAADAAGNAYITGTTSSADFPVRNPIQSSLAPQFPPRNFWYALDAFVTKINPTGSGFVYSTYLGGGDDDYPQGIAVDAAGQAYVTGWTASLDFPVWRPLDPINARNGYSDAFVTKLGPDGSVLVYSTYLGGTAADSASAIAADASGNAYVAGQTHSPDFPVFPPELALRQSALPDAFVSKIFDDAPAAEPGPVPGEGRVEQEDPGVRYSGNWGVNLADGHSGVGSTLSVDAPSRAVLTFKGTGIRWIGYRDEWSGIARVYLDGILQGTVDTYATPAEYQAVLFSVEGLANERHTLVIEVTGTKSAASGGAWIWVDAFDVLP